jgi:hypothetical protein
MFWSREFILMLLDDKLQNFVAVSTFEALHERCRFESVVHCFDLLKNIHIDPPHTKLFNHLIPTGHVMHQQFNIQQL